VKHKILYLTSYLLLYAKYLYFQLFYINILYYLELFIFFFPKRENSCYYEDTHQADDDLRIYWKLK